MGRPDSPRPRPRNRLASTGTPRRPRARRRSPLRAANAQAAPPVPGPVPFPLGAWIDGHASLPHQLGSSGMPKRMPSVVAALERLEAPDPEALRGTIARDHGVRRSRVFLTHGATEANTLALFFLGRASRRARGRSARCAIGIPEYPPLRATAEHAGFRVVDPGTPSEGIALSRPNNPTGRALPEALLDRLIEGRGWVVVDETFRGFTPLRSVVRSHGERAWAVGSFTKLYGGDDLRVGFVIVPERWAEPFGEFHGVLLDKIAPSSIAGARAILRDRGGILDEVRSRFASNLRALNARFPQTDTLDAPVWFDRPAPGRSTDPLGRVALRSGILVCPGSFFGAPDGVRLCLTRPTFPEDLEEYVRVRDRWTARSRTRRSPRSSPRRPSRAAPRRSRGGPPGAG